MKANEKERADEWKNDRDGSEIPERGGRDLGGVPLRLLGDDEEDEEDGDYSPENPDASAVLERVRSALREGGVSDEEIEAYTREATSRCYNHLMYTTMTWVRTRWIGPDYEPNEA